MCVPCILLHVMFANVIDDDHSKLLFNYVYAMYIGFVVFLNEIVHVIGTIKK